MRVAGTQRGRIGFGVLVVSLVLVSWAGFGAAPAAGDDGGADGDRAGESGGDRKEAFPRVEMSLPDGFVAERVYAVPNDKQGSWVCLTVDPEGRLIASDQHGALYRLTLRPEASDAEGGKPVRVERIDVELGRAQGLLHAFGSLYVMVNGDAAKGPGLYRVRDTDGDDEYDEAELLRGIEMDQPGAGHGPHAIRLGPDGRSLYLIAGNMAGKPAGGFDDSRVPRHWGEDLLLPRMPDASRGHARGVMAPGGWVARTGPDGERWELVCSGFRNIYDAAFNRAGDLFTYDADMELDINAPWYRPTRVNHVVSGGEYGWRNGSGKWPAYYPDSLPPVKNIGPGSPTGVVFGYDTDFPEPYRSALFLCDWSYGRLYTVHPEPAGGSYRAEQKLFAARSPMPVVDVVARPQDGSLYLVTGGRRVQSHVYRIRYAGDEPAGSAGPIERPPQHELRRALESYHRPFGREAVIAAMPHLDHDDRFVRFAARVALEHQPFELWRDRVLEAETARAAITGAVALARCGEASVKPRLLEKLYALDWSGLSRKERLDLLRAYALAFIRLGEPNSAERRAVGERLMRHYPAKNAAVNRELCRVLGYLETEGVIGRTLKLMDRSDSPSDEMHYAYVLRTVENGWSLEQRRRFFAWFKRARGYSGGESFAGYVRNIRADAEATLSAEEERELLGLLEELNQAEGSDPIEQRDFVQHWEVENLLPAVKEKLDEGVDEEDLQRGRRMFKEALCVRCHRFEGRGGVTGPSLSNVGGRFSPRDLLVATIEPNETVPDQYQAERIVKQGGEELVGNIVNLNRGVVMIRTNPLRPGDLTRVPRDEIESIEPHTTSLMPPGLLNVLEKEDAVALMVYLLRGGDDEAAE